MCLKQIFISFSFDAFLTLRVRILRFNKREVKIRHLSFDTRKPNLKSPNTYFGYTTMYLIQNYKSANTLLNNNFSYINALTYSFT